MPCSKKLKNVGGGQREGGQDDLNLDMASMSTHTSLFFLHLQSLLFYSFPNTLPPHL